MIVHHVFFWLKQGGSTADRAQLIEGIRSLGAIETVRQLYVGTPAATDPRPVIDASYDVSELLFFDDLEGQAIYQDHPLHHQFIQEYGHLWEQVRVYDVEQV